MCSLSSLALAVNQPVFKAPPVPTPAPLQFSLVVCGSHCAAVQAWVGGTPVEVQTCVPLEVRVLREGPGPCPFLVFRKARSCG